MYSYNHINRIQGSSVDENREVVMTLASFANTTMISTPPRWFSVRSFNYEAFFHQNGTSVDMQKPRLLSSCNITQLRGLQHVSKPISALGSGLEVSMTGLEELISLKDAKIVVESQDENKIQVRDDLTSDETQKVFDKVITNLARSAPPIPGFHREKGGKTSKVPKSLLLQLLGEERVTKFVIQEIVSSTITDYTKKARKFEGEEQEINTTQLAQELRKLFAPGKEFGFNAVMELEKSEDEDSEDEKSEDTTSSSSSSDM